MIRNIFFPLLAILFVFSPTIVKGGDVLKFDPSLKKTSHLGGPKGGACEVMNTSGERFTPNNRFIYELLAVNNLTIIRGSETFNLNPNSMRSYFLKVLLDPQVGDLFSGSSYGGHFYIVESREGNSVTLRFLETSETETYSIKHWISLYRYPVLPNGLPIPYIHNEIYFNGPKSFKLTDGKNWYTVSIGEGTHQVAFDNRRCLADNVFGEGFMSPETLGIFELDVMSDTNTMLYRPFGEEGFRGSRNHVLQLVDLKKVVVNGSVSFHRAGKVISIDPQSLQSLKQQMLTNPVIGDEFIFENQYVFIEKISIDGAYVFYRTINGGSGGGRPLESFVREATPLLPGGYPIPLEAPR